MDDMTGMSETKPREILGIRGMLAGCASSSAESIRRRSAEEIDRLPFDGWPMQPLGTVAVRASPHGEARPCKRDNLIGQSGCGKYQVKLLGLDVFDPMGINAGHGEGNDMPAWFPDTDKNAPCFRACAAFFPRTSARDGLKLSLRGRFNDSVWTHLSGTMGAPLEAGRQGQIAIKSADYRNIELVEVRSLLGAAA